MFFVKIEIKDVLGNIVIREQIASRLQKITEGSSVKYRIVFCALQYPTNYCTRVKIMLKIPFFGSK